MTRTNAALTRRALGRKQRGKLADHYPDVTGDNGNHEKQHVGALVYSSKRVGKSNWITNKLIGIA